MRGGDGCEVYWTVSSNGLVTTTRGQSEVVLCQM